MKLILAITTVFVLSSSNQVMGQVNIDSLWKIWNDESRPDTVRMEAVYTLAYDGYMFNKPDSAVIIGKLLYDFAKKRESKNYMANGLNVQGISLFLLGDYDKSVSAHKRCLAIRKEVGDKIGVVKSINNIALVYKDQANYKRAIDYFTICLKTSRKLNYKAGIASSLGNMGVIYSDQNNNEMALKYYNESLDFHLGEKDKNGVAICKQTMGVIYARQGNYDKAIKFFEESLQTYKEVNNLTDYGNALTALGTVYVSKLEYKRALELLNEAMVVLEKVGNKRGMCFTMVNIADVYIREGNYTKALAIGEKCMILARESGSIHMIKGAADILYRVYKITGKQGHALTNYEIFVKMSDSIQNENNKRQSLEQDFKNEYDKKAAADSLKSLHERQVAEEKNRAKQEKELTFRYALYAILALTVIFGIFMFTRFRITRNQKNIIEEQKLIVEKQKHLVEEKQQEVMDSIHYAKRIQQSQLPHESYVDKNLKRLRKQDKI